MTLSRSAPLSVNTSRLSSDMIIVCVKEQAKVVLSVVAVLIFLPAMFFTNGGAEGGAPVCRMHIEITVTVHIDRDEECILR